MARMLDIPTITVCRDGVVNPYYRIEQENHTINYAPKDVNIVDNKFCWEILYLPIDTETFITDKEHKFFGIQYTFYMPSYNCTFLDGCHTLEMGVCEINLSVEIRRIRYYIDKINQMCIDHVFDPLYPPGDIDGYCMNDDLKEGIYGEIGDICNRLNVYYADKRI